MIINNQLDHLTKMMMKRQNASAEDPLRPDAQPYILFLGAGCSRAAGVPSIEEIAERELSDPDLASFDPNRPHFDHNDKAGSVQNFYQWLETKSPGHVFRLFQAHYANTPVPLFYKDLALLIKNKFFNRILTTNFDTLLEQALSGAGLAADYDYEVISFGIASRPKESRRSPSYEPEGASDQPREPVSIVKLHGDMAAGELMVTPTQIEELLRSKRYAAKEELRGDLIMVGYELENPKLNDWLSSYRKRELWWVGDPTQSVDQWGESVEYISGELGQPGEFFSQMSLRLLRLPVLREPSPPVIAKSLESAAFASVDLESVMTEPDEQIVVDDLRGQIRRVQASLSSLEQKASPDERPTNLQVQIDYQKQQLMSLEDQLRSLSTSGQQVIELLQGITNHLQTAKTIGDIERISNSTIDFFVNQCEIVEKQYASSQPNQQIISAAIGGVAILAERLSVELGPEVIKPEEVRSLTSFVPTVATRGIK